MIVIMIVFVFAGIYALIIYLITEGMEKARKIFSAGGFRQDIASTIISILQGLYFMYGIYLILFCVNIFIVGFSGEVNVLYPLFGQVIVLLGGGGICLSGMLIAGIIGGESETRPKNLTEIAKSVYRYTIGAIFILFFSVVGWKVIEFGWSFSDLGM